MEELANKIQIAINTIQATDIKASYDNLNHMLAVMQLLADVRDQLKKMGQAVEVEVAEIGNAHAE